MIGKEEAIKYLGVVIAERTARIVELENEIHELKKSLMAINPNAQGGDEGGPGGNGSGAVKMPRREQAPHVHEGGFDHDHGHAHSH